MSKKYNQLEELLRQALEQNNSIKNNQTQIQNEISKLFQVINDYTLSTTSQVQQHQIKIKEISEQIEIIKSRFGSEPPTKRKSSSLPSQAEASLNSLEDKFRKFQQEIVSNIKEMKNDINDLKMLRNNKSLGEPNGSNKDSKESEDTNMKIQGLITKMNELKRDYQSSFKGLKQQI